MLLSVFCAESIVSPQASSLLSLLPLPCSLPTARISILNVSMKMSLSEHANEALLQFQLQSRLILDDFHAFMTQTSPLRISGFSSHLRARLASCCPDHDRAVLHHRHEHCSSLNFHHTLEEGFPIQSQNIYPCHWVSSHTVLFVIMTLKTTWHILYYSVISILSLTTLKKWNICACRVFLLCHFSQNTLVTFGTLYYIFN